MAPNSNGLQGAAVILTPQEKKAMQEQAIVQQLVTCYYSLIPTLIASALRESADDWKGPEAILNRAWDIALLAVQRCTGAVLNRDAFPPPLRLPSEIPGE
jgi:hypothetical protein